MDSTQYYILELCGKESIVMRAEEEKLSTSTRSNLVGTKRLSRLRVTGTIRTIGRVRRNAVCPCGSGKKFKNCCLIKMKRRGVER